MLANAGAVCDFSVNHGIHVAFAIPAITARAVSPFLQNHPKG
jgi:hypothetical protein